MIFTQPTISTLHPAQSPLSPSSTSLPCHPAAPHVRLDICFPARQCVRSGLDICVSCLGWMFVCQVWARCLCVRSGLDVFLFSNTSRIASYTSPKIHRRLSHFSLFLFLSKTAWLTLALYVRSVRFFVSFSGGWMEVINLPVCTTHLIHPHPNHVPFSPLTAHLATRKSRRKQLTTQHRP